MSDVEKTVPEKEHEHVVTLHEDIFIPDHVKRVQTPIFEHTKKEMNASGLNVCAICGDTAKDEKHHFFCESAFANAYDWEMVKEFMLDRTTQFYSHKLQKVIDIPVMHPVRLMKLMTVGFDWENFDTTNSVTFVDSKYNMIPLCEWHHRGSNHGIHAMTFPSFIAQAFLKPGFIFSKDEE